MKEQITLARLRSLQDSVSEGVRKPFDLYDVDTSLFARVGKTRLTFYVYIARGQRQKLKSLSAHEMTKSTLDHLRSRARKVAKEYEKFDVEIFDSSTVKTYLDSVYKDVASKGTYGEINRLPDSVLKRPINQLFLHHLERWKRDRLNDGITHDTLRKQYYALHSMLEYAVRQGHVSHHHTTGLKFIIDKNATIAKVYSPDQMIRVQRVLKSCCLRDQAMILFTVLSGSRPSETMRLKVSDIDFEGGVVFVRASGTKTQVSRYLDLTPKLSAYSRPRLPLIPDEACHPFHAKAATDSTAKLPPWQAA